MTKNKSLNLALGSHGLPLSLQIEEWAGRVGREQRKNRGLWVRVYQQRYIRWIRCCLGVGGGPRAERLCVGVWVCVWREWHWIIQGSKSGSQWWGAPSAGKKVNRRQTHFVKSRKTAEGIQKRASLTGCIGTVCGECGREWIRKAPCSLGPKRARLGWPLSTSFILSQAELWKPGMNWGKANKKPQPWDWHHRCRESFS